MSSSNEQGASNDADTLMQELSNQMDLNEAAKLLGLVDGSHVRTVRDVDGAFGRSQRAVDRAAEFINEVLIDCHREQTVSYKRVLEALRPHVEFGLVDCLPSAFVSAVTDLRHLAYVYDIDLDEVTQSVTDAVVVEPHSHPFEGEDWRKHDQLDLDAAMDAQSRVHVTLTLRRCDILQPPQGCTSRV